MSDNASARVDVCADVLSVVVPSCSSVLGADAYVCAVESLGG